MNIVGDRITHQAVAESLGNAICGHAGGAGGGRAIVATVGAGVAEYLTVLKAERGLSPNTLAAYRRDLSQYLDFLAGTEPDTGDLDRFVERLTLTGLAPASVARKLAAVRGLHRFLVSEGHAADRPDQAARPGQET